MLASMTQLAFKRRLLSDRLRKFVDDIPCRRQYSKGSRVMLAGQGDACITAEMVCTKDDYEFGVPDRLFGLFPNLGVDVPSARIVYVGAYEPQSTCAIDASYVRAAIVITRKQTPKIIRFFRIRGPRQRRRPEWSLPKLIESCLSSFLVPLVVEQQRFIQSFEELSYRAGVNRQPISYCKGRPNGTGVLASPVAKGQHRSQHLGDQQSFITQLEWVAQQKQSLPLINDGSEVNRPKLWKSRIRSRLHRWRRSLYQPDIRCTTMIDWILWSLMQFRSFTHNFYENALFTTAVEFAVEYLLPGAKVQPPCANRDHDFPAHYLPFNVGIRIVLTGAIVQVICGRLMRGKLFQEFLVVLEQTALVVVDENRSSNVHRVNQDQSFFYAALAQTFLDLWGDVDESPSRRDVEPKLSSITLHFEWTAFQVSRVTTYNDTATTEIKPVSSTSP